MLSLPRGRAGSLALFLIVPSILFAAAPPPPGTVVYHLDSRGDFESFATRHAETRKPASSAVTDSAGRPALRLEVPAGAAPEGFYHGVVTPPNVLRGGQQYLVTVRCQIEAPVGYANYFYVFARNSTGTEHDLWQKWIDLPGANRTITFPIDLKAIPGLDGGPTQWTLYLGIKGSGTLLVQSFTVVVGAREAVVEPKPGAAVPKATGNVPLATGAQPFVIDPPAATPAPTVISAADYHLVPEGPQATASTAEENAVALQKAFQACAKGPSQLIIPPGTYRIAALNSLQLIDLKDVVIDGQGATLLFAKLARDGQAFSLRNCTRLRIQNLIVDWDWDVQPIASMGLVSNVSADGKECDFTFPGQTPAQTERTRTAKWAAILAMDAETLTMREMTRYPLPPAAGIVAAGGNVLHVTFPVPCRLASGQSYCIRHLYYEMTAFKTLDSSHLVFQHVEILSMPGMGWLFSGAMHHWALLDCHIRRTTHPRQPFTTAADGVHASFSQGHFLVKDCTFTGMGDDAINLHDNCYQGALVPDPQDATRLTLTHCPPHQLRIGADDTLAFYQADYSPLEKSGVTRQVASVSKSKVGDDLLLQFTEPLPPSLNPLCIVRNTRYQTGQVTIEGCRFFRSKGRGILFSGIDSTVARCQFDQLLSTPIVLETEIVVGLWAEGNGASNLLIRDNTFTACNTQGRYQGAMIYAEALLPWGETETPLYRNISIVHNTFTDCPGPALNLTASRNVTFSENRIAYTKRPDNAPRSTGSILATRSTALSLGGNTWADSSFLPTPIGVIYDPETTTQVSAEGNRIEPSVR